MQNFKFFEGCGWQTFNKRMAPIHLNKQPLFSKKDLTYSVFLMSLFANIKYGGGKTYCSEELIKLIVEAGYSRAQAFKYIAKAIKQGYLTATTGRYKGSRTLKMTQKAFKVWTYSFTAFLTKDRSLDLRRIYNAVNTAINHAAEAINKVSALSKEKMAEITGHCARRMEYQAEEHHDLQREAFNHRGGDAVNSPPGQSETHPPDKARLTPRTKRDSPPGQSETFNKNIFHYNEICHLQENKSLSNNGFSESAGPGGNLPPDLAAARLLNELISWNDSSFPSRDVIKWSDSSCTPKGAGL